MIIICSAEKRGKLELRSSKEVRCVGVYWEVVYGWKVVVQVQGQRQGKLFKKARTGKRNA